MHLKFDLMYGMLPGQTSPGHPQEAMRALGITYQHATPQTAGEQWWFWNCENVPEVLPPFLEVLNIDPMQAVGFGLSREQAITIRDFRK